jgi:hypothetical protein
MINHDPSLYIYREKEKVINIEGQLRGFQDLAKSKACAASRSSVKNLTSVPTRST